MYTPKYFRPEEFFDPVTFHKIKHRPWEMIDDRLVISCDQLREKFGPITINNWHSGGTREWSGLRVERSPYFSPTSQHSFGRAADCIFKDVTTEKVRRYIIDNPQDFPFITTVEMEVSWLHFDVRGGVKPIHKVYP